MKKTLSVLLIAIMTVCLCSCGKKEEGAGKVNSNFAIKTESGVEVEVLTCAFDNEIMGYDEESSGYGYPKREGRVYINLTLKIKNNGKEIFAKDKLSAYCEMDGVKRDLQYNLLNASPKSDGDKIHPGCIALVNFLTAVEESDMNKDIIVKYTIDGKEYEKKVGKLVETDAFSTKKEVKIGEKITVEDFYEIEILDCSEKATIVMTNKEETKEYRPMGADKKFVDLTVKIKNNSEFELMDAAVKNYVIIDEQAFYGAMKFEDKESCTLVTTPVESGNEAIAHIFVNVENAANTDNLAMRFNIAGNCYYTYVKNA